METPRLFVLVQVSKAMMANRDPAPFRIVARGNDPDTVEFLLNLIIGDEDTKSAAIFEWTMARGIRFKLALHFMPERGNCPADDKVFDNPQLQTKLLSAFQSELALNLGLADKSPLRSKQEVHK